MRHANDKAEALFEQALKCKPVGRAAFLAGACRATPNCRRTTKKG